MYPELCFKMIPMTFLLGTHGRRARVKVKPTLTAVVREQS